MTPDAPKDGLESALTRPISTDRHQIHHKSARHAGPDTLPGPPPTSPPRTTTRPTSRPSRINPRSCRALTPRPTQDALEAHAIPPSRNTRRRAEELPLTTTHRPRTHPHLSTTQAPQAPRKHHATNPSHDRITIYPSIAPACIYPIVPPSTQHRQNHSQNPYHLTNSYHPDP